MPKSESSKFEALEALLAERRKHENYLAKLEERRATTPAHVYTRLRDEYATKLTDLQVRAAMEADALAEGIEAEEVAVAEVEAKLAAVVEERIEGELRAEVGEYETKEWSKKLAVLNATISQLEKERDSRTGAYEHTRELLAEAMSFPGAKSPSPAPAPGSPVGGSTDGSGPLAAEATESPAKEPVTGASDRPGSGPSKAATMSGGPSFDELAFLNSVVGRASAPMPVPPPTSRPATPARAATPARSQASAPAAPPANESSPSPAVPSDAPAPRPSGATQAKEPPTGPSGEPSSAPSAEPTTAPRQSVGVQREPSFSAPPASADDEPPSPLGRPTPRTSQAIKTLKCQECGTLNYPTEWYCERCGGELAAL